MLFHIETCVTLPLRGSIVITATPSPVILFCSAAEGYSGHGALRASALADNEPGDPDVPLRTLTMGLLTFCRMGGGLLLISTNRYSSKGVGAGVASISGGCNSSTAAAISIETSTAPGESTPMVSYSRGECKNPRPATARWTTTARPKKPAFLHFSLVSESRGPINLDERGSGRSGVRQSGIELNSLRWLRLQLRFAYPAFAELRCCFSGSVEPPNLWREDFPVPRSRSISRL